MPKGRHGVIANIFGLKGSKSPPPNTTKKNTPPTKPTSPNEVKLSVGGTRRRRQSGGNWKNTLRAEIDKLEAMNAEINAKERAKPIYLRKSKETLNAYRTNRKTIRNMMTHALEANTRAEADERIKAALKKVNELLSKYEE